MTVGIRNTQQLFAETLRKEDLVLPSRYTHVMTDVNLATIEHVSERRYDIKTHFAAGNIMIFSRDAVYEKESLLLHVSLLHSLRLCVHCQEEC